MFHRNDNFVPDPVALNKTITIILSGQQAEIAIHGLRLGGDDHIYVANLIEAQACEQTQVHLP